MGLLASIFGMRLRELRDKAGLSQAELAEKVGIGEEQVSRWETGRAFPRERQQESLAGVLGVSPLDFYRERGEVPALSGTGQGAKIKALRNGRPIKRLAPLANMKDAEWRDYEEGNINLTLEAAARMAGAMGVSVLEILGDQPEILAGASYQDYYLVPHYDVEISAGHGAINDHVPETGHLAFRRGWLRAKGLTPEKLIVVVVRGDSMSPQLNDGDAVLVDRAQREVIKDDVYVLRLGAALYVKRVQRLPGGYLKVSSINPGYESFSIDLSDPPEDVEVLGRVVWFGREL